MACENPMGYTVAQAWVIASLNSIRQVIEAVSLLTSGGMPGEGQRLV